MKSNREMSAELVASPCLGVCKLGKNSVCTTCLRSLDEIAAWLNLSESEKIEVIKRTEARRKKR